MAEAFRYAHAVPAEKLDWKPAESARSVLELGRELAKCADWAVDIMDGKGMELHAEVAAAEEWDQWLTLADCEAAAQVKLENFNQRLKNFPTEKLEETIDLPFGAGGSMRTFTMREMLDYPRWNAIYHLGQIAYIQTMYGDNENY